MRLSALILISLSVACTPEPACKDANCATDLTDDGTDGLTDDDAQSDEPDEIPLCDDGIEETFPEDGARNAYFHGRVEVLLEEEDPSATLSLTATAGGRDVPGTSTLEGNRVVFVPTDGLASEKEYKATLLRDCGQSSFTFQTSPIGDEVDTDALVGRTYDLDIFAGRIVQPPGAGALIPLIAGNTLPILASVAGLDGDVIDWRIGAGTNDLPMAQEVCFATAEIVGADFSSNPYFSFGTPLLDLDLGVANLPVFDAELSGSFAPQGLSMEGVAIAGVLDARDFASLVAFEADILCGLLGGCTPCADAEPFCLPFYADGISGALVPGMSLVEVTPADVCVF